MRVGSTTKSFRHFTRPGCLEAKPIPFVKVTIPNSKTDVSVEELRVKLKSKLLELQSARTSAISNFSKHFPSKHLKHTRPVINQKKVVCLNNCGFRLKGLNGVIKQPK